MSMPLSPTLRLQVFSYYNLQLGLRQQYITANFNPCHLLPPYLTACLLTLDFIRTVPKRYCNPMTGSHLDCSACPFGWDLSPNLPLLEEIRVAQI